MKLEMDEKLKHRIIGLAVIISLGAIFVPAMMKKSNQNIDHSMSMNLKLPNKPTAPNVVMSDEKDVFKTIKVARVKIHPVPSKKAAELSKNDSVSVASASMTPLAQAIDSKIKNQAVQLALNEAASHAAKKTIKQVSTKTVAQNQSVQPSVKLDSKSSVLHIAKSDKKQQLHASKTKQLAQTQNKPAVKKELYAVQLASFAQPANAQALVNKLKDKGFKANIIKTPTGRGNAIYKVYVGHSSRKTDVLRLKNQIASAMQLNGFVVSTGVS